MLRHGREGARPTNGKTLSGWWFLAGATPSNDDFGAFFFFLCRSFFPKMSNGGLR